MFMASKSMRVLNIVSGVLLIAQAIDANRNQKHTGNDIQNSH